MRQWPVASGSSYSIVESLAGSGSSAITLVNGLTAKPTSLAVDAQGNLLVADNQSGTSTIYTLSPSAITNLTATTCNYAAVSASTAPTLCQTTVEGIVSSTYTPLSFGVVDALAAGPEGSLYVADTTNDAVYALSPTLATATPYMYYYAKSTVASGVAAMGLATDAAGNLYVQSSAGVSMIPQSGLASVAVYNTASTPSGVAVDGLGNLYIADSGYSYVTQLTRNAMTVSFDENGVADTNLELSATLTNVGNLVSTAATSGNGSVSLFTISGGSSNACSFSSNILTAMSAGASCTMEAEFTGYGMPENMITGYLLYAATSPATSTIGDLTLTGTAVEEGYDTTTTIGAPSTTTPVYSASGTEVSFPITVAASSTSSDGKATIAAGPTTSNYIAVSIDSGTATNYYFTSTSGLEAYVTLPLSGLTAGTHTMAVSFPQQGKFMTSSSSSSFTITQQATVLDWSPSATTQQVSAPIGTGVLNAVIETSVAGNVAYAYGATPSCSTTSSSTLASSGAVPVDASTYLPVGSYTLYAIFCPTDSTNYASATASISYTVTQASTTTAVGASTMVVAPSGGNYTTLASALAALPTTGGTIYIAPGIYSEQNVISYPNVHLRGLGGDATKVMLTGESGAFASSLLPTYYANGSTTASTWGLGPAGKGGEEGSATLDVSKNAYIGQTALSATHTPNNFYAEYLTIQNTYNTSTTTTYYNTSSGSCALTSMSYSLQTLYNNGYQCNSQALALYMNSDAAVLNNVNLISQQHTLNASALACDTYCTVARQYLWGGTIVGNVDYVTGDAALVFDHTNFFTTWKGWTYSGGTETIAAQNKRYATGSTSTTNSSYATSSDYLSGFVCNACTLMSQGQPTGGSTTTVNSSSVLSAGSYTLTATFTPDDTTHYTTAAASVSLTVNQITPTISAWPTASAITYGQTLASATLSGGTASVAGSFAWSSSTTVPAVGTTSYSVTFAPTDTNYSAVTGAVSVTATAAASAQDFTLTTSGTSTQTVVPGSAVSYSFSIAPENGSYAAAVTFAATGLPTGATTTFSPSTIASAAGAQTVTMTIQTAAATARSNEPAIFRKLAPLALALVFLPLLGRRQGRHMSRWFCLLIMLGGMVASAALTGCGGNYFSQASKDYTVTVTATCGSIQHSFNVTLNVQ